MCACPVGAWFCVPGMYAKLSWASRWWRMWCHWRQLGACWPACPALPLTLPSPKAPRCWRPHVLHRSRTSTAGQKLGCILLLQAHVDKLEEKTQTLYDSTALHNNAHQRNNGYENYLSAETIFFTLGNGGSKTPVRSKKCKFWFKWRYFLI